MVSEPDGYRPRSRAALVSAYIRNRRIEHYSEALEAALSSGYQLCSLEKSQHLIADGTEKIVILRHDVDQPSPGVRAMHDVEQRLGVNSTFYFRWKTVSADIMTEIASAGSEVSFHFETVADLAAERAWRSREDLLRDGGMKLAEDRFLADLDRFRTAYGVPCRTVAGHGHVLNRVCQTLNNEILWPGGVDRDSAGLLAEAYDPDYLAQINTYVSDTVLEINGGFRYGRNLLDAVAARSSRILFLTHPNHWAFATPVRLRRIVKIMLRGAALIDDRFAYADCLRGGSHAGKPYSRNDFWPDEKSAPSEKAGVAKS